jgi:predicted site-specific integrase-resolvase
MLVVIEDLSTLLNGNISWQLGLFSESNEPTQNALRDAKRDRTFISSILQYLKADDGSKWDVIGQEKVKKLCTHLETIQDGIESLFSLSEYTESTRKRSLGEMTA